MKQEAIANNNVEAWEAIAIANIIIEILANCRHHSSTGVIITEDKSQQKN